MKTGYYITFESIGNAVLKESAVRHCLRLAQPVVNYTQPKDITDENR